MKEIKDFFEEIEKLAKLNKEVRNDNNWHIANDSRIILCV